MFPVGHPKKQKQKTDNAEVNTLENIGKWSHPKLKNLTSLTGPICVIMAILQAFIGYTQKKKTLLTQ